MFLIVGLNLVECQYAQTGYPFENRKEFPKNFPADFIAEGVESSSGDGLQQYGFRSPVFLASLPFKNVVVNGSLAEDGQKMSKRLKNYPDPMRSVSKYGADALRFTLLSMPTVKGEDASFSKRGG